MHMDVCMFSTVAVFPFAPILWHMCAYVCVPLSPGVFQSFSACVPVCESVPPIFPKYIYSCVLVGECLPLSTSLHGCSSNERNQR